MPWTTELTPNSRAVRLLTHPSQTVFRQGEDAGVSLHFARGILCRYTCRFCRACACPDARIPPAADLLGGASPHASPGSPTGQPGLAVRSVDAPGSAILNSWPIGVGAALDEPKPRQRLLPAPYKGSQVGFTWGAGHGRPKAPPDHYGISSERAATPAFGGIRPRPAGGTQINPQKPN